VLCLAFVVPLGGNVRHRVVSETDDEDVLEDEFGLLSVDDSVGPLDGDVVDKDELGVVLDGPD